MTPQPQTIILQGIDLAHFTDLLKQVLREVQEEMTVAASQPDPADALPNEVPAAMAAKFCNYKTAKSLNQWHGNGLTPIRYGKRLFYAKKEVVGMRKKLMNL